MPLVKQSKIEGTYKLGLSSTSAAIGISEQHAKTDDANMLADEEEDIQVSKQQPANADRSSDNDVSLRQQAYEEGYLQGEIAAKEHLQADYQARVDKLNAQTEEIKVLKAQYNDDISDLSSTLSTIERRVSVIKEALLQRSVEIASYAIRDLLQHNLLTKESIVRLIKDIVATEGLTSDWRLYAGKQIHPLLKKKLEWEVIEDHNLGNFEVEFRQTSNHKSVDVERFFDDLKAALSSLMAEEEDE